MVNKPNSVGNFDACNALFVLGFIFKKYAAERYEITLVIAVPHGIFDTFIICNFYESAAVRKQKFRYTCLTEIIRSVDFYHS